LRDFRDAAVSRGSNDACYIWTFARWSANICNVLCRVAENGNGIRATFAIPGTLAVIPNLWLRSLCVQSDIVFDRFTMARVSPSRLAHCYFIASASSSVQLVHFHSLCSIYYCDQSSAGSETT